MRKYTVHKGSVVRVTPCSQDEFDLLILDAKRIMGIEPAKSGHPIAVGLNELKREGD